MTDIRSRRPVLPGVVAGVALVGALVAAAVIAPLSAPAAHAAGSVKVANAEGTATADPDYATPVTVTGSGFQSITGGFGGVYVLFGWVDPASWRPSQGGEVGADYRYVPDSEAKDNAGFQRFVAFPGSDTADAANAVMDAAGGWTVDLVIPGASFESRDRNGDVGSVDCREVQCGIITIGAHGVKNAGNETFTPITFAAGAGASGGAGAGAAAGGAGAAAGSADAPAAAPASGASAARVGYTASTAIAGNALSFAGRGFAPGEQVVATLDDGVAAVGPLVAGAAGEVAAVLDVPADLRAGTHVLILTGAASGAVAQTEVTVQAADAAAPLLPAATASPAVPPWLWIVLAVAVLVTAVLLLTSLVTALVRASRRRRARRAAARSASGAGAASAPVVPTPPAATPTTAGAVAAAADTEVLETVRR
ncbi:hypothetical protein [Herbiconiux flava]|uniref:Heme exporter protein D n=1 Tax=Herbiconiux flava TaxID=881268 RepID=A0A852ST92_9MICO|nr:hypothetical protein [Herbiconiux flava]NYD72067.1 heme exporter protein D [Herbiconiux flava]GLK17970.1 hypothetical protein GCM10017602_24520 [Herbiconiux flava]